MKKIFGVVAALNFISLAALADFDIGTYRGTDATGKACAIELKGVQFENNQAHPFNERVSAVYNNEQWILSHSPVIDEAKGTILVNHDDLRGVKAIVTPTTKGSQALIFKMDHDSGKGPYEFVFISQDYKDASKNVKVVCSNLVF